MKLSRRQMLLGAAVGSLGLPPVARADEPPDLEVRDLAVAGDRALGRRFTLFVPTHLRAGDRVPLLVLLHGLGETVDERMGVYAWLERYGLASAYARLRRPPVVRTSARRDLSDERLGTINTELAARPFRGMVIACPFTPNVWKQPSLTRALDGYASWITEVVVPRARSETASLTAGTHAALDGCSLGGFVALESFLRKTPAFAAWGGVQSALAEASAGAYAERIARATSQDGPRALHVETSEGDPFRAANVALSARLSERGVLHDRLVLPGPHDQPFLREAGTLEMLLWHDRVAPAPRAG